MWSDQNLLLIYLSFHLSGLLTSDQKEPTVLRPHFFIVFFNRTPGNRCRNLL